MKYLEKLDVRFKIIAMAFLSFTILKAGAAGLALLATGCLALWIAVRFPVSKFIRHFQYLFFLLLIVFFSRAMSVSFFSGVFRPVISLDAKGAADGLILCTRLILLMGTGVMWMVVTPSSGVRKSVEWLFRPFPGATGKQAATMMGLMVRFLPVILDQAGETLAAQQSRCIQNRKNPVYRTIRFSVPLLSRTLKTADRLADAMEARCYSPENSRPPVFRSIPSDWAALLGVAGICMVAMWV